MKIGVPKEIKDRENRVGLTPPGAAALVERGHQVRVQAAAGAGSGFGDDDYRKVGADIVSQKSAWGGDLVTKVRNRSNQNIPTSTGRSFSPIFISPA